MGGRVVGFFRTGWRPLALWLVVSIILALAIAQVTAPPAEATATVLPSALNATSSNNLTAGNLTLAGGQGALGGLSANRSAWDATVNATTGFFVGGARSFATRMDTPTLAWTFGIFLFGYISYCGYRARRQVLVGQFTDCIAGKEGGASPLGKFPEGVSTLLTGELHRLRSLYTEVDDRRAIASAAGTRSGQLDYTLKAGDAGKMITDAISTENKIKIWQIEIPIGAVAGVLNRFFSGPQITGGFHKDGSLVVLNAFMSGPESRSWRVEGRIGTSTGPKVDTGVQALSVSTDRTSIRLQESDGKIENLDQMVRELACRIFTDLTQGGTSKWRATFYFTEGLREYRNCLLSRKNQLRNLKNAERRFLEAVSEDSTFNLAWYNLGVVYTELRHLEAAEQAFLKAVDMSPENWEPYYALALNRFNRLLPAREYIGLAEHPFIDETRLRDIIHPCEQAVKLNPDNPHLHILIGVCYRILALKKREPGERLPDPSEGSDECIRTSFNHHRIAVRNAWYALCLDELHWTGTPDPRAPNVRKVSSTALWDLARTYFADAMCQGSCPPDKKGGISRSHASLFLFESVLRQAIRIDENNAILWKSLGLVQYHQGDHKNASRSFELATKIDPDNLKLWLLFALAAQGAGYANKREYAARKILEFPSWLSDALSPQWQREIRDVLCREGACPQLCKILEFQMRPEIGKSAESQEMNERDGYLQALIQMHETERKMERTPETLWTLASLSYHIGNLVEDQKKKKKWYESGLRYLSDESLKSEEAGIWAAGFLSYLLALHCESADHLRKSYDLLMAYPMEIKKRRIDLAKIELMLSDDNLRFNAVDFASEILHNNPLGFNELFTWGRCLVEIEDDIQALSAFESALLLDPYDVDTLFSIGQRYWTLGGKCQKREDKENYWKQAIRYYEDAREALKAKKQEKDPSVYPLIANEFKILYLLGDSYFEISDYGKAITNYDLAKYTTTSGTFWEIYQCVQKSAEASLHKREFSESEKKYSIIVNALHQLIPEDGSLSNFLFQPTYLQVGSIRYAGELYILALLGLAYSYLERDAGLDYAVGFIEEADRLTQLMKQTLETAHQTSEKKEGEAAPIIDDDFLVVKIPLLEAEIYDHRGWLIFKKREKNNLENARKEIEEALSRKPDPDYYFHLARIHEALSRETPEKESNARMALAYCKHVLEMAPRKNLEKDVTEFRDRINDQLSKPGSS